MQIRSLRQRAFAFAAGIACLAVSGWAVADPPSRVARLGYLNGAVSFSPAGEDDWVQGTLNRPLTTADRLWSDGTGRAEIQVGGAVVRMGANTGLSVLNLDNQTAQLQLTQGTLNVRVRRLEPGQVFEVDTPNLAFTLRQPGEYRIEVDPDGNATTIVVRKGQGEAYGDGASYVVDARQPYRFTGTGLRGYQDVDAPRLDEFDRWSSDRDRAFDRSPSARYVSPDVVGYQDLDANGTWRTDPTYGNVWMPSRVPAGWAPYRDGHWAWVDPWGWTWVDDAPWGFAVSHYGRWANMNGSWGWVPGPVRTPAYYAPALVAFMGGSNFQLTLSSGNVGGVGWFPLAPREVYRPSYPVSRGYFESVNRSNTVVNNTVINNTYNTYTNVTNVTYANRSVPGAIVAVPATVFMHSQPVSPAVVRVPRDTVARAPVVAVAPVAPTEQSVHGAAAKGDKPPGRGFDRPVVARAEPPAAHAGFAVQQQQLAARPGHPLDDAARKDLKPAAAVREPVVKVVAASQVAPPTALPPRGPAGGRPGNAPEKADTAEERKVPAVPMSPVSPASPVATSGTSTGAVPARASPPARPSAAPPVAAPAARPTDEPRGKAEEPGKGEPRGRPATPPVVPPPTPPQPMAATPHVVPVEPPSKPSPQKQPQPQPQQPLPQPQPQQPPQQQPPLQRPPQQHSPQTPQPPQRPAPPKVAAPPQADPPVKPADRPAPAAAARPTPAPSPAQPPPGPKAEPRAPEIKPGAGKPDDKKSDKDDTKREEDKRKP